MINQESGNHVLDLLNELLESLRALKSEGRMPRDRYIAVSITEAEKLLAYFRTWVLEDADNS